MSGMKGKTALVTGGSQGYGKAIAEKLVREGARVIIAARNRGPLEAAREEIGCDGALPMDVTSAADWERARAHVVDRYGGLEVLVNNAGGAIRVLETDRQEVADIDAIIALNLASVVYGSRTFGSLMKERRSGTIINIASVCAKHAWPGWSVYAAAKAGVLAFSKGLYVELQPFNVRVTCLIPAAGSTDFMKHAGGTNMVMKLQAEDVAEAVASVCRLPGHVVVEEMTVWGIDQEVVPL
jgi:NAD(P)-dependent dehydrogenase (short-subunit alcohol dehydrogenase family)